MIPKRYDPLAELKRSQNYAKGRLVDHIIEDCPVRSFTFHSPFVKKEVVPAKAVGYPFGRVVPPVDKAEISRTSNWRFTLSWTTGHLTLTGDLGELTLTHYHALASFEKGLSWAATSGYDYLMSKVHGAQKSELDREGTLAFIADHLNEEPIEFLLGQRRWRDGKLVRLSGYLQEWRAWRREMNAGASEDDVKPPMDSNPFEDPENDCWERWRRFEEAVADTDEFYIDGIYDFTKASGRRDLLSNFGDFLANSSPSDVANFARRLGFDDWYGDYRYPPRTIIQIEAIQHGCRMILDRIHPKKDSTA